MKKRTVKRLIASFSMAVLFACSACGMSSGLEEDSTEAVQSEQNMQVSSVEEKGQPVQEDFSKNINVNRASVYAKTQMELPVTEIGRKIHTDVKANKDYKIVVMTRNSTNPYMVGMWAGGEKAGEDLGCSVQALSPSTQDSIEEQISIMESMMEEGVQGFVIHPSDSKGIQSVIDLADEKGIPVVAIGTAPENGAFMRTGVDYYETGYLVTKELCEAAGGKGKVVVLEGPAGVQNMEERKAGILDAVAEYPDMEVVASQTANCKRTEGMQVMENLLGNAKIADGLSVVACCNDEMALGAIQALKAQNVEGVLVGGADASQDASQAVLNGDLYCTYNTDPYGSTYLAVTYLVQYLNEGSLPEEYFVPFPSERHNPLITKDNVEDYIENYKWFE